MIKLLCLVLWTVLIPLIIGMGLTLLDPNDHELTSVSFALPAGTMIMWAIFQLVAVPMIIKSMNATKLIRLCTGIYLVLAVLALGIIVLRRKLWLERMRAMCASYLHQPTVTYLLWAVAAGLVVFQLYMAYTQAYADGDDAYYISVSTAAGLGGSMYYVDAYTGAPTTLDIRHALAPFPILLTYLAKTCHVEPAVMAHSMAPLIWIPETYLIYLALGKKLLKEKRAYLPVLLIVIMLLQIWGNYSIYPTSTFLLTRTRQGKAALGNIVLPMLLLLFLMAAQRCRRDADESTDRTAREEISMPMLLILVLATSVAGLLCSTLSVFLVGLMIGIAGLLLALAFRRYTLLIGTVICCIPSVVFAGLYFGLG